MTAPTDATSNGVGGERLFIRAATFMSVPFVSEPGEAKVAVFGIPFDCGTASDRVGARHGPEAIRRESRMLGPYHDDHPNIHLADALGLVDLGDVRVVPSVIEPSFAAITKASTHVVGAVCIPMTFGGDGAVTLPQLRGVARVIPELVVLHVDAHTDTYPGSASDPSPYTTATTFHRAAEEGVIDTGRSVHLGFHGDSSVPGAVDLAVDLGFTVIRLDTLLAQGIEETMTGIRARLGDRPVYLCFDMDIFDPSCAPGVCTPTWGGLSAREGIGLIRALRGLNLVAVDINTVSPPHDPAGMTAWLAATVAYEILATLLP